MSLMVNQKKQEFNECICLISYYPFKRNKIYKFNVEYVPMNTLEYCVMNDDACDDSSYSFREKTFKYIFGDKTYIRDKKITDLVAGI